MAVIFATVITADTMSGPSPAAADVADLGDENSIRTAVTKICLADESCTREIFLDMALGSRFLLEDYHATHVSKFAGPVALHAEFDNDTLRQIAEQVVEGVVHATKAAGLPLIDETAAVASTDQDTGRRRIHIIGSDRADAASPEEAIGEGRDRLFWLLLNDARAEEEVQPDEPCVSSLRSDQPSLDMLGALILVKPGFDIETTRVCIGIRLLQSLGLLSTLGVNNFDSLMSAGFSLKFTETGAINTMDRMMLSLLYDPGMKFGMTKERILEVFPEIYARHKPKNSITTETVSNDLIDPIDDRTLECLATLWCAEEMFLQMAVTGSELEPIDARNQVIKKKIMPATTTLVLGSTVGPSQKEAAHRGLNAAVSLANRIGLPVVHLEGEQATLNGSNTVIFVAGDIDADKSDDFALWLENMAGVQIFADMERQFAPNACQGVFSHFSNGLGIRLDLALLPGAAGVAPSLVERCVIEEFLQGFGLTADLRTGVQTLFDDRPDNMKPTGFDLFMLALLDHPAIMPGMTSDEVSSVFGQVHADVWSTFKADTWWLKDADIEDLPDDL